jgi:transcriptional regulator with XRE-family HTH domain
MEMEHDYIDRLTALRQDRDVGQKVIAHVLGCTRSTVSKYELRQSRYDINDLIALCKFYNASARPVPGIAGEPSARRILFAPLMASIFYENRRIFPAYGPRRQPFARLSAAGSARRRKRKKRALQTGGDGV